MQGSGISVRSPSTLTYPTKCVSNDTTKYLAPTGPITRSSIFWGISAIATFEGEGEGIIKISILKNGKLCAEKIVSGIRRFTASVTCK
jgi:hypothetical protein